MMVDDYTDDDRWDWDRNDDSQHCAHGTFIGSWWGLDILCGWCEEGISVAEMLSIRRDQAILDARAKVAAFDRIGPAIAEVFGGHNWNGHLAQFLMDHAERDLNLAHARHTLDDLNAWEAAT